MLPYLPCKTIGDIDIAGTGINTIQLPKILFNFFKAYNFYSSSLRSSSRIPGAIAVMTCMLFCAGRSVAGAVADALPPNTKDAPAAPKTGNVLVRLRFEACFACAFLACAMVEPS